MSLTVTKKTLGELVATRIRDYILDQGLKTGARLPTEQQFAEMFGVSRVVVREATKSLGYLGIIRAAPRRGLTVGLIDTDRLGEIVTFNWMLGGMDVPTMLKTWGIVVAGVLTISASAIPAADLEALAELAVKAEADGPFSVSEVEFNRKLLLACGSTGIAFFGVTVLQYLRLCQEKSKKKIIAKSTPVYRQVVEALKDRQADQAESLLLAYISGLSPKD